MAQTDNPMQKRWTRIQGIVRLINPAVEIEDGQPIIHEFPLIKLWCIRISAIVAFFTVLGMCAKMVSWIFAMTYEEVDRGRKLQTLIVDQALMKSDINSLKMDSASVRTSIQYTERSVNRIQDALGIKRPLK